MKNLKICALALSAGFILSSVSGCVTAKKDKTLKKFATGTAKVDVGESGDYILKYYRSNNV